MIAATLQRLKGTERIWIWFVLLPLAFAAVPLIFVTFASWDAVSPNGSEAGLWLAVLLVFPALLAIPVLLLCLVDLLFRNIRFYSAAGAWISLVFVVAFTGSVWIGESIRMNAFHRLAARSEPLIQAIRAFEARYGCPPENLEAMVPEFLDRIPQTGMGTYPDYKYWTGSDSFDGNPWALIVSAPSGPLNFDQFMYFPLTNYPATGYGGWLERVGDWAYVHE